MQKSYTIDYGSKLDFLKISTGDTVFTLEMGENDNLSVCFATFTIDEAREFIDDIQKLLDHMEGVDA